MLCSRLAAAQSEPRIAINEPFPVITLPALDGSMMSVADFRGKRILLHVFASW
ncbi:MAG: TlpA family protein disulfide reductase [Phycisphaerales bacterium]